MPGRIMKTMEYNVSSGQTTMTIDRRLSRKWYLTLIAAFFLVMGGLGSIRYLSMNVSLIGGSVPIGTQILCYAVTISAILYFVHPPIGCSGLLAVCFCAFVISVRADDPEASVFYAMTIWILLVPTLRFLRKKRGVCIAHRY